MANNLSFYDWALIENSRLIQNSFPDFVENSYGENYIIECNGNAEEVRKTIKDVLLTFNKLYLENKWLSNTKQWIEILPHQFTKNFTRELTNEEEEKYRQRWFSLSYEQKLIEAGQLENKPWKLSNWVEMMSPTERTWFWWGDAALGEKTKNDYFITAVKLLDDYYSFSPIETFFKNCGAKSISIYHP